MTYYYDNYVEDYGKNPGKFWPKGTYITPSGTLFDVDTQASVAHGGGFVIPFFRKYMHPDEKTIRFFSKKELLDNLLSWEQLLMTKKYDTTAKAQQMRLDLVRYLINVYKSKNLIWNHREDVVDFSGATGIPNVEENWFGRDVILKDILVQACNYDSIESQLYRTITTSKWNIYETFYDYILHDYKIFQIPKKIYDFEYETYMDYIQPEFLISDKELRLKEELTSICKNVPLEERKDYCRSKVKIQRYDFIH